MIDIHAHILPGIDDGPDTVAEAVAICRQAGEDGCEVILATPHQRHWNWSNLDRGELAQLRREVKVATGDQPTLLPGGEIRVDDEFLDELATLDPIAPHGPLALAGSHYLLLELDRSGAGLDPVELVHEVVVAGWKPIIAHPEFAPSLAHDLDLAERIVAAGARLQITAMSLTGGFGDRPRRSVIDLLDAGLVHFVASDAHNVGRRPPGLTGARAVLEKRWGLETAVRLTEDNPRAVIEDRPLEGVF